MRIVWKHNIFRGNYRQEMIAQEAEYNHEKEADDKKNERGNVRCIIRKEGRAFSS